jgi:membrane-associated phospholipid phosphatase
MAIIRYLFERSRKPRRGLLAVEWVMLAYMAFTLLLMAVMYTKLADPYTLFWNRMQALAITIALWGVYRLLPCRFTHFARIGAQLLLLSCWYPETFEFNRVLPNLDHIFAQAEQTLMGCQPALFFAERWNNPVWSELMHLGYASYFAFISILTLHCFGRCYEQLGRTAFVVLTSFFIYYTIYIFIPVTGPQYYYHVVGVETIAQGVFPSIGDYFATHKEMLYIPGWSDGFFYHFIEVVHVSGERPTAAFPSSHVGVSTIIMLLLWRLRCRKVMLALIPLYVLLCISTVYIQAHYVIDVIGGWISGVLLFSLLWWAGRKIDM